MLSRLLLAASALLSAFPEPEAHVALTFPPARKYDLDFLDTFRTTSPCGMHKGSGPRTVLKNGQDVEVTWHLGYPHRGGFKLELLDRNERMLFDLTPPGLYQGSKEQHSTTLSLSSDLECLDCSIRLERQALEWGPKYRFQSCADVDIVKEENYKETCLGNGNPSGSSCSCDRTFFGDRCQFKNDCVDDSDCNYKGQCLDVGGTSLPRKQCFCQFGFMGRQCQEESSIRSKNFTKQLYTKAPALNKVEFYYRFLGNGEFEGVMLGKGTKSFVAVGWRPDHASKACQSFPEDAPPPKGSMHAMDCVDYVIGTVKKGSFSRVEDYYSRDRSTPRLDSVYGGVSDLTGAIGWEEDGDTVIIFRKHLNADHGTDHDFQGRLHFVWAHGRADDPFYVEDELKYHGPNRGKAVFEVSSSPRRGSSLVVVGLHGLALCVRHFLNAVKH